MARFARKHPTVNVKKLRLWGYAFGKTAHVLLETSDDKSVFGDRYGEYNDNEFGRGVHFDEWWPDLYKCEEDEAYEINSENETVITTYKSKEGNDAIDKPLFELLKKILREANFDQVNKASPFVLGVEMGSSALEESWSPE